MSSEYYPYEEENENKANKLGKIISSLIENPAELYCIVEEESDETDWE